MNHQRRSRYAFFAVHLCAALAVFGRFQHPAAALDSPPNIPLASVDLKKSASGDELTLLARPQERCVFGDLDAMVLDAMNAGGSGSLTITLEPFGGESGGSVAPFKPRFSEDGEPEPVPATLSVTAASGKNSLRVFGLYICLDTKKENSCRGKAVKPYREILAPYRVELDETTGLAAKAGAADAAPEDKIYFFRPVFVEGKKAYFAERAFNTEDYTALKKFLDSHSVKGSAEILARIRELGSVLGSLPPTKADGAIALQLPYYRISKCRK